MSFLRKFPVFIFLFLCCPHVEAQTLVYGTITDVHSKPAAYAAIAIRQLPDSSTVQTGLTDSAGGFRLSCKGSFPLLIECIADGFTNGYIMIADSAALPVRLALAASAHTLNTVTVSSKRPLIEKKVDRTVFNVENSILAVGSDGLEMLKKTPGVHVQQGEVSITGKSTVSVMINDKLLQVSGDELETMLRTIPSDNIARIEVITTPPAKYDAEGNAGIINIVTKKSLKEGLNGNVSLTGEQRTKTSERLSGNFNYRKGKLNVFGNTILNNSRFSSEQHVTSFYPDQQRTQSLDQANKPFIDRTQLGADYNIAKDMIVGVLYTFGNTERTTDEFYNAVFTNLSAGKTDSSIITPAITKESSFRNVGNINYEWKIDSSGKKLNVDADYFTRSENDKRDFSTQLLDYSGAPVNDAKYNRTTGKQTVSIGSVKADVEWPNKIADLSFGVKASFIRNLSDNKFNYLDGADYRTDSARTNKFDYTENTQALYLSAKKTMGKFETQVGLRGEYTQTKGVSPIATQAFTNSYFKLFPTVYLLYTKDDDHAININYSRRIERPNYRQMNPFREYSTDNTYEAGNPFLQPSFADNLELSYTWLSKYTITASAEWVGQSIAKVSKIDTINRAFYFITDNDGMQAAYSVEASAAITPAKWWECNVQLSGAYTQFHSSYYNSAASYGKFVVGFETENSFTLNKSKTLLAELSGEYVSAQQSDFDLQQAFGTMGAGIKALFLQKRLAVALSGEDIFRSEKLRFKNLYNGTLQDHYNDARVFSLAVSWKFGNKNVRAKREHVLDNDEMKRAN